MNGDVPAVTVQLAVQTWHCAATSARRGVPSNCQKEETAGPVFVITLGLASCRQVLPVEYGEALFQ